MAAWRLVVSVLFAPVPLSRSVVLSLTPPLSSLVLLTFSSTFCGFCRVFCPLVSFVCCLSVVLPLPVLLEFLPCLSLSLSFFCLCSRFALSFFSFCLCRPFSSLASFCVVIEAQT